MINYSRTTISVPSELKARMKAVEEPVNWSAIACRAFEQTLAEIARRRGTRDMKEAIMRLRASKRKSENVQYTEGFREGRAWAMSRAEADELGRLAEQRAQAGTDWETLFEEDRHAYGVGERMAFVILGIEPDRDGARDFWGAVLVDTAPSERPEFVRGFAEGALEVWDEVSDQL